MHDVCYVFIKHHFEIFEGFRNMYRKEKGTIFNQDLPSVKFGFNIINALLANSVFPGCESALFNCFTCFLPSEMGSIGNFFITSLEKFEILFNLGDRPLRHLSESFLAHLSYGKRLLYISDIVYETWMSIPSVLSRLSSRGVSSGTQGIHHPFESSKRDRCN